MCEGMPLAWDMYVTISEELAEYVISKVSHLA